MMSDELNYWHQQLRLLQESYQKTAEPILRKIAMCRELEPRAYFIDTSAMSEVQKLAILDAINLGTGMINVSADLVKHVPYDEIYKSKDERLIDHIAERDLLLAEAKR